MSTKLENSSDVSSSSEEEQQQKPAQKVTNAPPQATKANDDSSSSSSDETPVTNGNNKQQPKKGADTKVENTGKGKKNKKETPNTDAGVKSNGNNKKKGKKEDTTNNQPAATKVDGKKKKGKKEDTNTATEVPAKNKKETKANVVQAKESSSSSSSEDVKTPLNTKKENNQPVTNKMDTSSDESSDEKVDVAKTAETKVKPQKANEESSEESSSSDNEILIAKPDPNVGLKTNTPNLKRKREADNSINKKSNAGSNGNGENGGNKIRVGNLPYSVEGLDDEIKDTFKSCGVVTNVETIYNKEGKFAGVVILDFETPEAAESALGLNDQLLYDRKMYVSYPKPDFNGGNRQSFKGNNNFPKKKKPPGCTTVWIGNLSYEITEDEVYNLFSDCGEIKEIRWPRGDFTGIGWVEFTDTNAPDTAIAKAGTKIRGRDIRVDYAEPKKRREF